MKTTYTYDLHIYDVWGNAKDGWYVNDVYPACFRFTVKAGKDGPSDLQLNRAIGTRGLVWDGEADHDLYANNKHGKPICELRRV